MPTPRIPIDTFDKQMTSGQVAKMLGIPRYRLLYLFEHEHLPEPPRVGGRRMIPKNMLPLIAEKLNVVYQITE